MVLSVHCLHRGHNQANVALGISLPYIILSYYQCPGQVRHKKDNKKWVTKCISQFKIGNGCHTFSRREMKDPLLGEITLWNKRGCFDKFERTGKKRLETLCLSIGSNLKTFFSFPFFFFCSECKRLEKKAAWSLAKVQISPGLVRTESGETVGYSVIDQDLSV